MKFSLFTLTAGMALATDRVPRYRGQCPDLSGTPIWNPAVYTSHNWWNPIASPFFWNFEGTSCQSATYIPTGEYSDDGGVYFTVINQGLLGDEQAEIYGQQRYASYGTALEDTSKTGTASVIFYEGTIDPSEPLDNYMVLDTDNVSFSYVWSCKVYKHDNDPRPDEIRPILWILLEDRDTSKAMLEQHVKNAMDIIRSTGWEKADEFESSIRYWNTAGCPNPPDSPYNN